MFWSMMSSMGGEGVANWEAVPTIRFGLYNICNGQNGGLESTLRVMSQVNVDLGLFQETKGPGGVYTRDSVGYWVTTTEAPIPYCDGVAVFYREAEHVTLEALRLHGPNVVSFHMALGGHWWYVMGCYIAPVNASTIDAVVVVISM